jgi:cell pole-organizing protein PopZ
MADTQTPEPDMDEILASIRRIIAEDDTEAPHVDPTPPAHDAHGEDVLLLTRRAAPEPSPFEDPPAETPAAAPTGPPSSAEPAPPEPASPEPVLASPPPAKPAAAPFAFVKPTTTPFAFVKPVSAGSPTDSQAPAPIPPAPVLSAPTPSAPVPATPVPAIEAEPEDSGAIDRKIAETAAAAFKELSLVVQNTQASPSIAISAGGPTLEEITRDLLRPMLKAWLDENLPAIVRARVDEEVERIARGHSR